MSRHFETEAARPVAVGQEEAGDGFPEVPPGPERRDDHSEAAQVLWLLQVPLKHRWRIVGVFLATAIAAWGLSKLQGPIYKAEAAFLVAEKNVGRVGDLDDQVFATLNDPVGYYKRIAVSGPIIEGLLKENFPNPADGQDATLLDIWEVEGKNREQKLETARKEITERIEISNDRAFPNLMSLEVYAETPPLAAEIANRLIELLARHDIELKTQNIQLRINFIQTQLEETEKNLAAAENRLDKFQQRNRILQSPQLLNEKYRMEREVTLQSEIFVTLRKELELARIAEKKEVTAITVIDKAVPPQEVYSPRTLRNVAIAGALGLLLAVAMAFLLEYFSTIGAASNAGRQLSQTWSETKSDLRRVFFLGRGKKKPLPADAALPTSSMKSS